MEPMIFINNTSRHDEIQIQDGETSEMSVTENMSGFCGIPIQNIRIGFLSELYGVAIILGCRFSEVNQQIWFEKVTWFVVWL